MGDAPWVMRVGDATEAGADRILRGSHIWWVAYNAGRIQRRSHTTRAAYRAGRIARGSLKPGRISDESHNPGRIIRRLIGRTTLQNEMNVMKNVYWADLLRYLSVLIQLMHLV